MDINIKNLKKCFNKQVVLNIENLNISKGLTCIMGPNGCGKSTLLNILSGQLDYEEGTIKYNNRLYSKDLAKEITLVHQKPFLLNRSVFDNIAYPLKVRKINQIEINEKVNTILEKFNIANLRNKNATRLSGGEGQKVALARGLVFEPELLMLDEPTANIDKSSLELMESIISDYIKDNRTVILVTHSQQQAKRMTKLDKGEFICLE